MNVSISGLAILTLISDGRFPTASFPTEMLAAVEATEGDKEDCQAGDHVDCNLNIRGDREAATARNVTATPSTLDILHRNLHRGWGSGYLNSKSKIKN